MSENVSSDFDMFELLNGYVIPLTFPTGIVFSEDVSLQG